MSGSLVGERVMIAIGSNVGNPAKMVHDAFKRLRAEIPGVEVVATSAMYQTDPCYYKDQVTRGGG